MTRHPSIRLVRGDITRVAADAIVNAANPSLTGGAGVNGAILRAGGPEIVADLEARYGQARRCDPGQAVLSAAGALPARFVIHAVGPIWHGGDQGEDALLASAYRVSLGLAAVEGCRSIAFPAISCGVYGYPLAAAARIALTTVRAWLEDGPGRIDLVTFVLFSEPVMRAFERAADRED